MNKTVPFIILVLVINCFFGELNAQVPGNSNSFTVTEIVSPVSSFNYQLNDSADFVVEIRNQGPNTIIPGDLLKISFNIFGASGNNTQSYDTNITAGRLLQVGAIERYTLLKNIDLGSIEERFTACADISGSFVYPVNDNKFPSKCSPFVVSLDKEELKLNNVYFANGRLYISLNAAENTTAEVFDITGKSIKRINLTNAADQSFPINLSVNGFYFMKVFNDSGAATTLKFVINQ